MSKRKVERNKKIYALYKSGGYSMYALAKRFRVTPPRILVIIRREKQGAQNSRVNTKFMIQAQAERG